MHEPPFFPELYSLQERIFHALFFDNYVGNEPLLKDVQPIISSGWLLIGRQVTLEEDNTIDLMAMDRNGVPIIINFNNKIRKDVLIDTISAAAYVATLGAQELMTVCHDVPAMTRQYQEHSLEKAFSEKFGIPFPTQNFNEAQLMIIVEDDFNPDLDRAINYLIDRGNTTINGLYLSARDAQDESYAAIGWMNDFDENMFPLCSRQFSREIESEWFISFDSDLEWQSAVRDGYVISGIKQHPDLLAEGDRVWTYLAGKGYVGVGVVSGIQVRLDEYISSLYPNQSLSEYLEKIALPPHPVIQENFEFVYPVTWLHTLDSGQAFNDVDLYCCNYRIFQPTSFKWRKTVMRLKQAWGVS